MAEPRFQVIVAPPVGAGRWNRTRYLWRFMSSSNRVIATSLERFTDVETCLLGIKIASASAPYATFRCQNVGTKHRYVIRISGEDVAVTPIVQERRSKSRERTRRTLRHMEVTTWPVAVQPKYRGRLPTVQRQCGSELPAAGPRYGVEVDHPVYGVEVLEERIRVDAVGTFTADVQVARNGFTEQAPGVAEGTSPVSDGMVVVEQVGSESSATVQRGQSRVFSHTTDDTPASVGAQ